MRTFYAFKVNNMFQTFYNNKSNILYKMFREIYYSNDEDIINSFRLFERITLPFDKRIFNNYIMLKHRDDLYYNKKGNKHTINNIDEVTKLVINNTFLKIKTNTNFSTFIKDLIDTKENVFIIDFDNKDYFWLNEIKYSSSCIN